MRKLLLSSIIVIIGIVYIGRLTYLQLLSFSPKNITEDTAIKAVYDYPERGYIYDRNGKLLVANQPAYDVMIIPREVKPLDTLEFCSLLNITKEEFIKKYRKSRTFSPRLPSVFVAQLSKSEYAVLQEKMRKYDGFYIQKRSLRYYLTKNAANVLGYISEVNEHELKNKPNYTLGELIGRQGVEKEYEGILRGRKGVKYIQKDRFNRDIGPYKEGTFDTIPEQGKEIHITIDAELQKYGELLMQNKRGGIVALEPKSGEILALVSAPSYDPSLLVGRQRSRNYTKLYYDSVAKPTFDRGLLGEYPPGSPFKALTALIGLQEGVINTKERISCHGGYYYGARKPLGCHHHPSPLSMVGGIANSCNSYFCTVYRRIIEKYDSPQEGIDHWKKHLNSFGLGNFLGYDLPIGRRGYVPDSKYYNRSYQYPKYKWFATATISNAIGQGEVLMTPMQLANMTAAIANRGYYYTPHVIKSIEGQPIDEKFTTRKETSIDPEYFEPVIQGMFDVYNYGTAKWVQIPGIHIAGKTGTAENYTRINGERVQLTDHSIFVAFAPVEDPKIALAIFVENGYWGSRWAGKIAGLLIEKYIKGTITRTDLEDFILNGSLEEEYAKPLSGKPFSINQ